MTAVIELRVINLQHNCLSNMIVHFQSARYAKFLEVSIVGNYRFSYRAVSEKTNSGCPRR